VGYGARSSGIANVYVYDGEDVFVISRWDEFGAGVQKISSVSISPRQQVIKGLFFQLVV
jgi:hypothetical protein